MLGEKLTVLTAEPTDRRGVTRILQNLVKGLSRTQDDRTGLWYQVVDKGDHADNWHDTSGSAMFVYTIQRAIDMGYVDASKYRPVVKRGYDGILSKALIGKDGLVDIYDA